jgi:hypothetical protein
MLARELPSGLPVLLLACADTPWAQLPWEVREIFGGCCGNGADDGGDGESDDGATGGGGGGGDEEGVFECTAPRGEWRREALTMRFEGAVRLMLRPSTALRDRCAITLVFV